MIILNTNLNRDDFEFASLNLKIMIQSRDKKDVRNYDKHILSLAMRGQVEALELYCKRLSLNSTMNSRVVAKFKEIENKGKKEPREYMALAAFYQWHALSFKHSFKDSILEELGSYDSYRRYTEEAFSSLNQKKALDPLAAEWAFTLSHKSQEQSTDDYSIQLANIRNQLFTSALKQTNESVKMKFLNAYAINTILYAPDAEFNRKLPLLSKISVDLQKSIIAYKANLHVVE